jgi:hypothetical protein
MEPDFKAHLFRQLGFLWRSCQAYDEGHIDEAVFRRLDFPGGSGSAARCIEAGDSQADSAKAAGSS